MEEHGIKIPPYDILLGNTYSSCTYYIFKINIIQQILFEIMSEHQYVEKNSGVSCNCLPIMIENILKYTLFSIVA